MITAAVSSLRVVLLGPPASGKGTQGKHLAATLGLDYLGTGALLREQVEQGTDLGKQAESILARGGYLPDSLICPILAEWLSSRSGGWVLDGFPRSLPQAKFLDVWLAERSLNLTAAVSLKVPYLELLARVRSRVECPDCRWTGQAHQLFLGKNCPSCRHPAGPRPDDAEENFRCRYAEFTTWTLPVTDHYQKLGLLCPCDATAPQDEVAARLLQQFTVSTV